jgi:peptidoglycan/xylan/chitin deacetylase (PgdA/CDA1 family)
MRGTVLSLLCRILPRSRAGGVRILLFHEIREERLEIFRRLILFIRARYRFISPAEYESHLGADEPVYLISFDDGFASQLEAARTVLDPLGIKALFFVCTGGVGLRGEKALDYIIRRMGRNDVQELSPHLELPAWGDLVQLVSRGHVIGSHTMHHARLSEAADQAARSEEIIRSGDEIEKQLGTKVDWFSYPFGDIDSIDGTALEVIGRRYRYCCSGVRGINRQETNRLCILRENADMERAEVCVQQAVLGALDFYYYSRRKKLGEMADHGRA